MFRPTRATRLREWLARIIMPKSVYPENLSKLDTGALDNLIESSEEQSDVNPLLKDVFDGAPDEFIHNLSFYMDETNKGDHPNWDEASFGVPYQLTHMFMMRTEWVIWYLDGRVEVVELPRTGGWDENGNYVNYPPVDKPIIVSGVQRAAKVGTLNDKNNGGVSMCRWQLFTV